MATTAFRSEIYYKFQANEIKTEKPDRKSLGEIIDSFVEYPGSRKGEYGEWRFPEWLGAKIEQMVSGRTGSERR